MGGMKKKQSDERLNWLLLLVLALIWGSSFILMKRGLFHDGQPVLTPFQMASARLSIAWLALTPFLLKYWQELRKHWLPLLGSGVLGNGIPAFLFASAQSRISSSLSGMLNSLTPLFALVLGVALFRQRMRLVHVAGVLLGLCGAVGLIALGSADGLPSWSIYALMPVIATACYGMSANIVKHHLYMLPATAPLERCSDRRVGAKPWGRSRRTARCDRRRKRRRWLCRRAPADLVRAVLVLARHGRALRCVEPQRFAADCAPRRSWRHASRALGEGR